MSLSHSHTSPFLVRFHSAQPTTARLICFPYAGASARLYARWHQGFSPCLDVCAIELPGRGAQRRAPMTRIEPLIEGLVPSLEGLFDVPCFFFGHSLGALLAYTCAHALRLRGLAPRHLFVSARVPPHHRNPDAAVLAMSDDDFVEMLRVRGGTAPQILAEPELMAVFLPILRADFALLDSYRYVEEPPLHSPITAFGGTHDDWARPGDLDAWRMHTVSTFTFELIEGGHFFLDAQRELVTRRIARTIESTLATRPSRASIAHGGQRQL